MKTIKNSDIRFEINSRIVYVPSFEMKFYTVSQKEYYFKKTDADVTEVEVSGETKYYLDLDWSQLKYLGKGVLNYQCTNNIADPSFPDGEYNQLIEKTTDYFIDTFTVNPDDDEESVIELIEKEEEERKEADDELQANIDAEESARTAADEALSGALDTKLDVTAYTPTDLTNYYTKDETSGKTELDTAFAAKLDATAYTPTDLTNYYTKDETSGKTEIATAISDEATARTAADETLNNAITAETSARTAADEALSGAVDTKLQDYYLKSETSGKTEIQTALDGKSNTGHTHDERYYRKNETSGATELEAALVRKLDASAYTPTDLSNYYTKDETSGKSEIAQAITDEATARANADTALSGAVDTALLGYVNNAAYVSTAKTINLLHGETVIASIDATDFIKDGMIDTVSAGTSGSTTVLVITWNTDAGKSQTIIDIGDMFEADNYYTKSDVDSALSGKADTTAVTEAINQAVSGKADSDDVYLKSETSGATELNTAFSAKLDATAYTPTDLTNYYTKSETSGKTELETAFSGKLDTTAYTPTDLSNYYTKSETSGKTEIQTALGTKQDTLIAGDNITISGNVISAAGGDLSNYYTKAEVDEMSEVAAQGINDLNTNKLDVTAYTPTDLTNYYTKSETSGKTEIQTALGTKQDTLVSGTNIKTVNNESLLGSGNITIQGGGGNDVVELTQAEYDELVTSGTVDPDVFYVITDATPIDLSQYWTSAQTQSAITQSVSGKQDTLSAGTGIDITSNVISVTGSTGGKAIEAGRGITVTTGATADTVSFNLPLSSSTVATDSIVGGYYGNKSMSQYGFAYGDNAKCGNNGSAAIALGINVMANGSAAIALGSDCTAVQQSVSIGRFINTNMLGEIGVGIYNVSSSASTTFGDSGNTLFSVGNGTSSSARHNAFEIRQNGDIYITSGGTDIKLQDNLGGGGSSINVVQTTGTSTGDVMSQDAVTSAVTAHTSDSTIHVTSANKTSWDGAATNASTAITNLGGLKLQQITQSAYDALTTKDASTLYVIVN